MCGIILQISQQLQHFSVPVLSSSKLYVVCSVCSLMPGSADSSVGDMQAAARQGREERSGAGAEQSRAEQSRAEQADWLLESVAQ